MPGAMMHVAGAKRQGDLVAPSFGLVPSAAERGRQQLDK